MTTIKKSLKTINDMLKNSKNSNQKSKSEFKAMCRY